MQCKFRSTNVNLSVASAYIIDKDDKWTEEFAVPYLRLTTLFNEIIPNYYMYK